MQTVPPEGVDRFTEEELATKNDLTNANCQTADMSYTLYDDLGRIVEAGEMHPKIALQIEAQTGRLQAENVNFNSTTASDNFPRNISDVQNQVTRTQYNAVADAGSIFKDFDAKTYADNICNRVGAIYYYNTYEKTTAKSDYDNAIYYNYDIHGNVKEIVQHNKRLQLDENNFYSGAKHVNYEYDLISGNVNKVIYQKDKIDQFIHQYTYDADNRITSV